VQAATIAPSLGAVETLIEQPALMSYFELTTQEREAIGIHDSLIRLAVGIEDAEDLIADCRRRSTPPAQRRREQDEQRAAAAGGVPAAAVSHARRARQRALELREVRRARGLDRGAGSGPQDLREGEHLLERLARSSVEARS